MTEPKAPRKRPARTPKPKAAPAKKKAAPDPSIVLACGTGTYTGRPCGRPASAEPVTLVMPDGGTFEGIACLRCRERLAR